MGKRDPKDTDGASAAIRGQECIFVGEPAVSIQALGWRPNRRHQPPAD